MLGNLGDLDATSGAPVSSADAEENPASAPSDPVATRGELMIGLLAKLYASRDVKQPMIWYAKPRPPGLRPGEKREYWIYGSWHRLTEEEFERVLAAGRRLAQPQTQTGRFSPNSPNIQNIPRDHPNCRCENVTVTVHLELGTR